MPTPPLRPHALRFIAMCFCGVSLPGVPLRAADDPAPALVATINGVVDLALGQSPAAIQDRLPEIRSRMSGSFSTEVIVQRAFGRNWQRLTPVQQAEAVDLVGRLIIRTYALQLSASERPVITVTASRAIGPDRHEIVSTVVHQGDTVNVVYRLGRINGSWKVYDVLAEGVSVVGNYRQQFDAHFQKNSAEALLALLKDKLAVIPAAKKERE
ncbi:MAG: ABC transporter substrate-binding protein [Verrucomicrobia bacterium]|nr:ABC transporter substrate-binding protein [Verrucomicrobiota bacterium]